MVGTHVQFLNEKGPVGVAPNYSTTSWDSCSPSTEFIDVWTSCFSKSAALEDKFIQARTIEELGLSILKRFGCVYNLDICVRDWCLCITKPDER